MGKVEIIEQYTLKDPLSQIGFMAGVCWGAKRLDEEANIKRAYDCIQSEHGRVLEFPDVFLILSGYSAKVIREFYTHIGGAPTRLQESTRYVNYDDFEYINPCISEEGKMKFDDLMSNISNSILELHDLGEKNEDVTMALPLAYETKIVCKINLRSLINMFNQRTCNRAYWEFKVLMKNLKDAFSNYSAQWKLIADELFVAKCKKYGYCTEKNSCGLMPTKKEVLDAYMNRGKCSCGGNCHCSSDKK